MSDKVWASLIPINTNRLLAMSHALDKEQAIEAEKRDEAGEPLGPEWFPVEIWTMSERSRDYARLPPIFYARSAWVVNGACAAVLRRFDLGLGALYPVRILKLDRVTPYDGEYFCLNIGNAKHAFLPAQSNRADDWPGGRWHPPYVLEDGDFAVSEAALQGPDLWVDPLIVRTLFMSEALGDALKAAKLDKPFILSSCRVMAG